MFIYVRCGPFPLSFNVTICSPIRRSLIFLCGYRYRRAVQCSLLSAQCSLLTDLKITWISGCAFVISSSVTSFYFVVLKMLFEWSECYFFLHCLLAMHFEFDLCYQSNSMLIFNWLLTWVDRVESCMRSYAYSRIVLHRHSIRSFDWRNAFKLA